MNTFTIFIFILASSDVRKYNAYDISLDEILRSYQKVLDYLLQNPDFIGLSGIFGTVRSKALITDVILPKPQQTSILYIIQEKCEEILKLKRKILNQHNDWVLNVSDPLLWMKKISFHYLEEKCYNLDENLTRHLLDDLKNEAETACITPEMFEFCNNNSYYSKLDSACSFFLFGDYKGIGYETTHRLLYLQIARAWRIISESQATYVEFLCKYIYQQAKATQGKFYFFDLFLEQVFLCGVEGYREFLNKKWLKVILENQLIEGCFPLFGKGTKLNSSVHYRGCSDHATGLASAVLALHIRFNSIVS